VRSLVATTPFRHDQITIPVTLSIGIASLSDCQDASVDQLISLADSRLYMAKAAGRNCCRGA